MVAQKKTFYSLILIGISVLTGGVYSAYGTYKKVAIVESWPTADGYVAESAIRWHASTSSPSGLRQAHSYFYRLEARTDYMIDGQYFSSDTPGINEIIDQKLFDDNPTQSLPEDDMIHLFMKVPQGAMVPVHYNPMNMTESYIFSKLPFWDLYGMAVFLFLFGTAILLIPTGMFVFKSFSP